MLSYHLEAIKKYKYSGDIPKHRILFRMRVEPKVKCHHRKPLIVAIQ